MALESYKMVLTFSWFKKQNHNNSKEEYMTDTTCGLQRLKVFIIQPLLKKKKKIADIWVCRLRCNCIFQNHGWIATVGWLGTHVWQGSTKASCKTQLAMWTVQKKYGMFFIICNCELRILYANDWPTLSLQGPESKCFRIWGLYCLCHIAIVVIVVFFL